MKISPLVRKFRQYGTRGPGNYASACSIRS